MEKALQQAIAEAVERIVAEEAKTAAIRVENRVRGMGAQIAATVVSRMSVELFGERQLKIILDFNHP